MTDRNLLRRAAALLLLLAIVVVVGGGAEGAALRLSLLTTETDPPRLAALRYGADLFSMFNRNVEVSIASVDENDLLATLNSRGGPLPDLIDASADLMLTLAVRGDIDAGAAREVIAHIGAETFRSGPLAMLSETPGAPVAIPFHGWVQAIWYRKDWFDRDNMPPPDSWSNLLAAAEHFNDPANHRYGIILGTNASIHTVQTFELLALAHGASLVDSSGAVSLTQTALVEALDHYRQLAAAGPPDGHDARARDYFMQGRAAMMVHSTSTMPRLAIGSKAAEALTANNFKELAGAPFDPDFVRKIGVVGHVADRAVASSGSIDALGFGAGHDPLHRTIAQKLAAFLLRPDLYVAYLHSAPGGMLPTQASPTVSERFYHDPLGVYRRYDADLLSNLLADLDNLNSLNRVNGHVMTAASALKANGVLGRLIADVVAGAPATAATRDAMATLQRRHDPP